MKGRGGAALLGEERSRGCGAAERGGGGAAEREEGERRARGKKGEAMTSTRMGER